MGRGTIEGGCKRVIGALLEQTGRTWMLEGARRVIQARSPYLRDAWDQFWHPASAAAADLLPLCRVTTR